MKNFIEVTAGGGGRFLLNIDCIESVSADYGGGANIVMASIYSRENWRNDQEIVQSSYPVQESYEKVKAMIEEAMK